MHKKINLIVSSIVFSLFLSGCSFFSPVHVASNHAYTLNAVPSQVLRTKPHHQTILVSVTSSNPIYATTQMAYTVQPDQVAYFAVNEWAETPAQMLQTALIQTLQNAHAYRAVVSMPYVGRYDYLLSTDIITLLQNVTPKQIALLHMTLRAMLQNAANGCIIAIKQFSTVEPIYPLTPYGGVLAANRAEARLLAQIARFLIKHSH